MSSEFIDDPLFRQRYRFGRDGDVLRVEIRTEPGGGVGADHVHPQLEERYEVRKGEVTFRVDGKPRVAGPGAKVVVAAGVRHSFQNTGNDTAHVDVEADPALRLRESIEEGLRWPGPRASAPPVSRAACAHWSSWRRSPTATARPRS